MVSCAFQLTGGLGGLVLGTQGLFDNQDCEPPDSTLCVLELQRILQALEDVSRIRSSVLRLLEEAEAQATSDAEEATSNQAYLRLVEGESGWFAGWQFDEARKRISDIRLLRKNVESDLNQLELQLLRGDPSLTWIRELLSRTRGQPDLPAISKGSVWLQEQIASGALPKDPELLRTLLEQARRDPELVVRLVTLAKDKKGKDIYTRALNDPSNFNEF